MIHIKGNIIKMLLTVMMVIVTLMMFLIPLSAETPQTDSNSNLPYFISGVERPKMLRYNFDVKDYSATVNNGYLYIESPGVVYWPNSQTGLIDSLSFDKVYIKDRTTYDKKVRFQIDGTGTEEYPQYYIEIQMQRQPFTYKCVGYYEQEQTYNMDDIKTIAPGFQIYDGTQKAFYDVFFTETTFPYKPISGGTIEEPETTNIYQAIYDLMKNQLYGGTVEQGSIQDSLCTLMGIIACFMVIVLPMIVIYFIIRRIIG